MIDNGLIVSAYAPNDGGGYDWEGWFIFHKNGMFGIKWDSGCSCNDAEGNGEPEYEFTLSRMLQLAREGRDPGPLFLPVDPTKDENADLLLEAYAEFLEWYKKNYQLNIKGATDE